MLKYHSSDRMLVLIRPHIIQKQGHPVPVEIGGRLRTWIVRMTNFWPPLVALCLTGLGRGDSPLVILSLRSLAPSFVLSIFPFLYLYTLSFPFVFFSLSYVFMHKVVFLNIIFITYQK